MLLFQIFSPVISFNFTIRVSDVARFDMRLQIEFAFCKEKFIFRYPVIA